MHKRIRPAPAASGDWALIREAVESPESSDPRHARLQHLARQLHGLGARALFEFLAEHLADGGDLVVPLERYATIDLVDLHLTGGDRFPLRLAALNGGRQ